MKNVIVVLPALVILSCTMQQSESAVNYGGVLKDGLEVTISDPDVHRASQMMSEYIEKHFPETTPNDTSGAFIKPDISDVKKMKLQYTEDDKTPFHYEEVFIQNGKEKFQKKKAVLGIDFHFTFSWQKPDSFVHHFVVTMSRQREMFIYEHTFYNPSSLYSKPREAVVRTYYNEGDIEECYDKKGSSDGFGANLYSKDGQGSDDDIAGDEFHQEQLKILSYNIWNFNSIPYGVESEYSKRITKLGKTSAASDADIIAFQEVRFDYSRGSHLGPNQNRHIGKFLPKYQFVYQPAKSFPENSIGRREEGLSIFSKYPIINHDYTWLSRNTSDENDKHQRICLHAEIMTNLKTTIHVFATHLSLSESSRDQSVYEIWQYMQQFAGPAVLLGDLNAEPTEMSIRFLQGSESINHTKTQGLKDAWLIHHAEPRPDVPGVYGSLEARDQGLTFSAVDENPRKRIDYIFVRDEDIIDVESVKIIGQESNGKLAASDHFGLMAILKRQSKYL